MSSAHPRVVIHLNVFCTQWQAIADGHVLDVLQNYTTITPHVTIANLMSQDMSDHDAGASHDALDEAALVEAAYTSRCGAGVEEVWDR